MTPYKIDIVQGNVVTREQLAVLRVGMPRAIAQDVLGTPLLTSVFHADRWDYVFTLKRQGSEPQARKVTVFFANDAISRIEADELPSETEFVSTLRSKAVAGPLPPLTASEDALKKFPAPKRGDGAATPAPSSSNSGTAYPPLEPSGL
jgi:outer membrane protein assembly factor BamE